MRKLTIKGGKDYSEELWNKEWLNCVIYDLNMEFVMIVFLLAID
jgi:hypothetical protein